MLIACPNCRKSYEIEPSALRSGGKVRCVQCGTVWLASAPQAAVEDGEASLSVQSKSVNAALHRLQSSSNAWITVPSIPLRGAIGFALEARLYDYLAHPDHDEVPTAAAGLCVFHKHFQPPDSRRHEWQIAREKYPAYADDEKNLFLQRAETIVHGEPCVLYARAMEIGCRILLDRLGYVVEAYRKSGKRENGIDVLATMRNPGEEEASEGHVVALECKTTRQGFEKKSRRILLSQILSSLKKAREEHSVRDLYPAIRDHGDKFDYLFASNREFTPRDFREREGYFILRGIEIG